MSDAPMTNGVTVSSEVVLTPQQVARLFANMDSGEQAECFKEIGRIAREEWDHGDMQWCMLGQALREDGISGDGWQFAASIGAFTMTYAWAHCERIGVYP